MVHIRYMQYIVKGRLCRLAKPLTIYCADNGMRGTKQNCVLLSTSCLYNQALDDNVPSLDAYDSGTGERVPRSPKCKARFWVQRKLHLEPVRSIDIRTDRKNVMGRECIDGYADAYNAYE